MVKEIPSKMAVKELSTIKTFNGELGKNACFTNCLRQAVSVKKIASCAVTVFFVAVFFLCMQGQAHSAWPFGKATDVESADVEATGQAYVARVGDRVITTEFFLDKVNKLHMSERVGRVLKESKGKGFVREDYRKFLDELINENLMEIEALRLGLESNPVVLSKMHTYKINLFLGRLRREEVTGKVIEVSESELIEEYRRKQIKEGKKPAADDDEAMKESLLLPGAHLRKGFKRDIIARKRASLEKKFFKSLRKKARVKIYKDALMQVSSDMADPLGTVVAKVNGEYISASEVLRLIVNSGGDKAGVEKRTKIAEKIILHKLLDRESLRRGYEKDPVFKTMIAQYKRERLIDVFKRKVVLPLVKVEEKDILNYYNDNQDEFKLPEVFRLFLISTSSADDTNSIARELERGADFEYLAKLKSNDGSRNDGGDVGWMSGGAFPASVRKQLNEAKKGDLIGPFAMRNRYYVVRYHETRDGGSKPLKKVRKGIDKKLGTQMYKDRLSEYMVRLREMQFVEINEQELVRISAK